MQARKGQRSRTFAWMDKLLHSGAIENRATMYLLYEIIPMTAMNSAKIRIVSHLCQIYVSKNRDSGVDNRLVNLLYFSRCKSWRDVRVVYGAGLENQ